MRILISSAYKVGAETGTAQVSENLLRYFSKKNDVAYLCLGKFSNINKNNNNFRLLVPPSVKMAWFYLSLPTPHTIFNTYSQIKLFGPNVIHTQNIDLNGLISLIYAKLNKIPFFITFHFLPHEGLGYVFPQIKNLPLIYLPTLWISRKYAKVFINNSCKVFALNCSAVKSLQKISDTKNIKVINNGLELKDYLKITHRKSGKIINFIFLGTYCERKNEKYLLKVFKNLPTNFHLDLYGNFKSGGKYLEDLRKTLKTEKIKNVALHDFVSGGKKIKAFENAHYFISASTQEVQSLVIIEALAAGLPVIALKNETVDELINHKKGLVLNKGIAPEIFAEKLKSYIVKTGNDYLRISRECKKGVEGFDINIVGKKLLKFYKEAINN